MTSRHFKHCPSCWNPTYADVLKVPGGYSVVDVCPCRATSKIREGAFSKYEDAEQAAWPQLKTSTPPPAGTGESVAHGPGPVKKDLRIELTGLWREILTAMVGEVKSMTTDWTVRPLMAGFRGSLLWGDNGPDSDGDVYMVYDHPPYEYINVGKDQPAKIKEFKVEVGGYTIDVRAYELTAFLAKCRGHNTEAIALLNAPGESRFFLSNRAYKLLESLHFFVNTRLYAELKKQVGHMLRRFKDTREEKILRLAWRDYHMMRQMELGTYPTPLGYPQTSARMIRESGPKTQDALVEEMSQLKRGVVPLPWTSAVPTDRALNLQAQAIINSPLDKSDYWV